MDKTIFMKKLKAALGWSFTAEEITDILTDYEGFFVSGNAEGKDEGTICAELGDPQEIARNLAETLEAKRTSPLWLKIFIRMLLTAVVGVVGYILTGSGMISTWRGGSILFLVLIAVMWLLLFGLATKLPPVAKSEGRAWNILFFAIHALIAVMVIANYSLHYILISQVISMQAITPALIFYNNYLLPILLVSPLLIAVISVFAFYCGGPQFFTVISHSFGAGAYMWTQFSILYNLDNTADLSRLYMTFAVYGISAIVTILLALLIRALSLKGSPKERISVLSGKGRAK